MDKEHSKKFGGLYSVIPICNKDYKDVSVGIIDVPEHTEWTKDMIVAQELLLSEILYDKTGEYGKIKEAANKQYDPKKVKEELGVHLMVKSSFRSYEEQNEIY